MWFRAISARKSYTETFTTDEESADRTPIIVTNDGGDNTRTLKGFLKRYKDLLKHPSLDEKTVDLYCEGYEDFKTALNNKLQVEGVTKCDAAVSVLTDRLLELADHRSEQALVQVLKDGKLSPNMLVLITKKLLECGADPNGTTDMTESSPLNIAVSKRNVQVVKLLLSKKARTDVKDRYGYTPLMNAVDTGCKDIVELLIEKRANRFEKTIDQKTLLHLAAGAGDEDLVEYFINKGLSVEDQDKNGWTPLHEAAFFGFQQPAKILLENGVDVDVTNHKGQTPLHIAAQEGNVEVVELLCKNLARLVSRDKDGNTPMDLWANRRREIKQEENIIKHTNTEDDEKDLEEDVDGEDDETEDYMGGDGEDDETEEYMGGDEEDDEVDKGDGDHEAKKERSSADIKSDEKMLNVFKTYCVEQDKDHRLQIDKVMNKTPKKTDTFTKDDVVAGYLRSMTPFGVIEMMKQCRNVGKKSYSFLHDFVEGRRKMTMKESTKAVMDKFVLGQSLVFCEIMEEDEKGHCPDQDGKFQAKDPSLLDVIVELDRKNLVQHPAMMALVDKKWNRTAKWLFTCSFILFLVRMVIFAAALIIAARPDLDNPGCYRNSLDYFRLVLEVISLICFIIKGFDEIVEMKEYKNNYFLDYFNYLQLLGIVLALMIIPFRAATTWCASTGVGYCALPVGNVTDISHHCITASQIQWIFASLAYLANCLLLLEYLSLFRMTGIYVRIIVEIIKSDIVKFTVLYGIFLLVFVGSFYFGLRAGVTVKDDGQLVSDVSVFPLESLYPWHVLFTGIRILLESGSVVDYFSSDDTTGEYIGYQWFSVVLYLLFLFIVIIVLLNILIAQMSDSYSRAHEDVEGTFTMARARIVARLLKGSPLWGIPRTFRCVKCLLEKNKRTQWFVKSFKASSYQKYIWIESPEDIFSNEKKSMETDARLECLDQKVDKLTKLIDKLNDKFTEMQDDDKNKDSEGEQTDGGEIDDDEDGGVSGVDVTYDKDHQPKTNL